VTGSLRELLERGAATSPDTVVVSAAGQDVTWRALQADARSVAAALVRDGVKAQDRVVFVGKNDPSDFGYLFGCALAGAVPVPLNWRLSPAELTAMISDSGAGVVFTDEAGAPAAEQAEAELPGVRTVVAVGEHGRWPSLARWRDPDGGDPGVPVHPGDIAFQLYTSGTTGPPKGAMFANGTNLRVLVDDISVAWGFTQDDVSLVCMPLFHMGGLAWALAGMARNDLPRVPGRCWPPWRPRASPWPSASRPCSARSARPAAQPPPASPTRSGRWCTPVPPSAPPACARPRRR
jgi:long-chain acyl-CoA synthetase